jgi:hypothetical protein
MIAFHALGRSHCSHPQGTSMPISIPMMQRRSSAADLAAAAEERVAAATFVPPHMLHRQETERFDLVSASGGELGLSPSAKREKLLARNAILRSTGFIEVQQPPTMGELPPPALCRASLPAACRPPLHFPWPLAAAASSMARHVVCCRRGAGSCEGAAAGRCGCGCASCAA